MRLTVRTAGLLSASLLMVSVGMAGGPANVESPRIPVAFEPNRGQFEGRVQFASQNAGYLLELRSDGIGIRFANDAGGSTVKLVLEGRNPRAHWAAEQQAEAKTNYLVGASDTWVTGVSRFGQARLHDVYPGIDLVFHGAANQLEYDFIVRAGADPATIRYHVDGATVETTEQGDLVLTAGGHSLRQRRPAAYQTADGLQRGVDASFNVQGREIGFALGTYDPRADLVIDPVLVYENLGGNGGAALAVTDATGNIYAIGNSTNTFTPTTGALQTKYGGGSLDVIVFKLTKAGTLVWATYLGGTGFDQGVALALDAAGNVVVMGATNSTDFPMAGTPLQKTNAGGYDAFVAKIDPTGSKLLYSTYIGGTGTETVMTGGLDSKGNVVVGGYTTSKDLKVAGSPVQSAAAGGNDGFLFKLSADGSTLLFSTYFGGSGNDAINSMAFDQNDYIYLAGQTTSTDLKTTTGVAQAKLAAGTDAFVAKLDPNGSTISFLTYLGGSGTDFANGIAAVGDGSVVWVTGYTASSNYPVSTNAVQATYGGTYDAFLTKLDLKGALLASSYLGGTGPDQGTAVFVTGSYVTFVVQSTTTLYDNPGPPFGTGKSTIPEVLFATMNSDLSAIVATIPYTLTASGTYFDFPICTSGGFGSNTIACAGTVNGPSVFGAGVLVAQIVAPIGQSTISSAKMAWGVNDIAQNAWIEIHGSNLVPATTPSSGVNWGSAPEFATGRMPTQIGGVSVTVNGKPAYIDFFCSAVTSGCANDQINVLTPLDNAYGPVQIVVKSGTVTSSPYAVIMTTANPTFLMFTTQGYVVATHADYSVLGPATLYPGVSTPAGRGEQVILWMIGFGLPSGTLIDGSSTQSGTLPSLPACRMGLTGATMNPMTVGYAGVVSPGLYQLNVTIPNGAQSGDNSISCTYADGTQTQLGALITVQ